MQISKYIMPYRIQVLSAGAGGVSSCNGPRESLVQLEVNGQLCLGAAVPDSTVTVKQIPEPVDADSDQKPNLGLKCLRLVSIVPEERAFLNGEGLDQTLASASSSQEKAVMVPRNTIPTTKLGNKLLVHIQAAIVVLQNTICSEEKWQDVKESLFKKSATQLSGVKSEADASGEADTVKAVTPWDNGFQVLKKFAESFRQFSKSQKAHNRVKEFHPLFKVLRVTLFQELPKYNIELSLTFLLFSFRASFFHALETTSSSESEEAVTTPAGALLKVVNLGLAEILAKVQKQELDDNGNPVFPGGVTATSWMRSVVLVAGVNAMNPKDSQPQPTADMIKALDEHYNTGLAKLLRERIVPSASSIERVCEDLDHVSTLYRAVYDPESLSIPKVKESLSHMETNPHVSCYHEQLHFGVTGTFVFSAVSGLLATGKKDDLAFQRLQRALNTIDDERMPGLFARGEETSILYFARWVDIMNGSAFDVVVEAVVSFKEAVRLMSRNAMAGYSVDILTFLKKVTHFIRTVDVGVFIFYSASLTIDVVEPDPGCISPVDLRPYIELGSTVGSVSINESRLAGCVEGLSRLLTELPKDILEGIHRGDPDFIARTQKMMVDTKQNIGLRERAMVIYELMSSFKAIEDPTAAIDTYVMAVHEGQHKHHFIELGLSLKAALDGFLSLHNDEPMGFPLDQRQILDFTTDSPKKKGPTQGTFAMAQARLFQNPVSPQVSDVPTGRFERFPTLANVTHRPF